MRRILLIGAGKSSSSLIQYLLKNAAGENWHLTVADVSEQMAKDKTGNHPASSAIAFNIADDVARKKLVGESDIIISMLPANMHLSVANECVDRKKSMLTASYVSAEMESLNSEVKSNGLIFLNECGLDPGIDHMSAMKIIDDVKHAGGEMLSFKSYTGGLVAPESNDNPWKYKFTWNPRNVVLAGQGTARFIEEGEYKYIPYNRVFTETEKISISGIGELEGYANRDSLSYRKSYGLENIPTMIRGTLRQSPFCSAWNVFVKLGLTDDSYKVEHSEELSYGELVKAFLPGSFTGKNLLADLSDFAGLSHASDEMKMIEWTGILSGERCGLKDASPAMMLQSLLEKKWKLNPHDHDMIVMQHQFIYQLKSEKKKHVSTLVVKGDDSVNTAMAKTVGLPLAIAAKLILNKQIKLKGVCIPTDKEIYQPVLSELESLGIVFNEERMPHVGDAGNNLR